MSERFLSVRGHPIAAFNALYRSAAAESGGRPSPGRILNLCFSRLTEDAHAYILVCSCSIFH
jgi:hypothetical protein